jgi:cell division protein FtsB
VRTDGLKLILDDGSWVCYRLSGTEPVVRAYTEARSEHDMEAHLQQENAHLREHVDRLKSDSNAIEHEAREQLHYAKPGEVIYTLPAEPQTQTQPR